MTTALGGGAGATASSGAPSARATRARSERGARGGAHQGAGASRPGRCPAGGACRARPVSALGSQATTGSEAGAATIRDGEAGADPLAAT